MKETPKNVIRAILSNEIVRVHALCGLRETIPRRFHLPPITDDFSQHRQLAAFLDGIGFDVQRIERAAREPLWKVELRRGIIPEGEETHAADVALTNFLNKRGQACVQYEVKSRIAGDRVTATVTWDCGQPGWFEITPEGQEVVGHWQDGQSHPIPVCHCERGGQLRLRF